MHESLPYELWARILDEATVRLPPRATTRALARLSTVSRGVHNAARDLLYAAPSLPARAVWLLSRTLRHEPALALKTRRLDVYSLVDEPLLRDLLAACPRLKDVRLRITRWKGDRHWAAVLDLLQNKKLERLRWDGGDARDLSRCFTWGLKELAVHEHDFYAVEPLLRLAPGAAPPSSATPTLETLSLSHTSFPYNFFERLHPFLGAITSLSLRSDVFYSSDLDRALIVLGPTLRTLSLLGAPSGGRALLARAFSPLISLTSLEVSGTLVEPTVFTCLPRSTRTLCIVPGELDPNKLHLELLRRKVGLNDGSEGLVSITLRFVDLHDHRDPNARAVWAPARERLELAAMGLGANGNKGTLVLRYLE